MRRALIGFGCAVLIGGCFSEPPAAAEGSSTSGTEAGSSTSSSSTGSSTTSEASSGSTTSVGDSSSAADSGSTTGEVCEAFPADLGRVGADMVIVIDDGVLESNLDWLWALISEQLTETSIAVVAPEGFNVPINASNLCLNGCAGCDSPNRVVLSPAVGETPRMALLDRGAYDCIFRGSGDPGQDPTRNLWIITTNQNMGFGGPAEMVLEELDVRVNLTCPGCGEGGNSALESFVDALGGGISDLTDPEGAAQHGGFIAAERVGCRWEPTLPLGDEEYSVVFRPEVLGLEPDEFLVLGPASGIADCIPSDNDESPYKFFVGEGPLGHVLCPQTCVVAQAGPAVTVSMFDFLCSQ